MAKRKTEPKKDDEALCLLVKAKKIVEDRWIRGHFEYDGKVCALGAIGQAFDGNAHLLDGTNSVDSFGAPFTAAEELASVIRVKTSDGIFEPGESLDKIPTWNDTSTRKRSQVVAAFDRAIKKRIKKIEAGKEGVK